MSISTTASRITYVVAFATASLMASQAGAKSYTTQLSAFVPTSCSADIQGGFSQVGSDSFSLGHVIQFCNTRFQLELSHLSVSPASQLSFGGSLVSLAEGSSVLKTLADPTAYGSDELVIHGMNAAEADAINSTLTVTISPIGF